MDMAESIHDVKRAKSSHNISSVLNDPFPEPSRLTTTGVNAGGSGLSGAAMPAIIPHPMSVDHVMRTGGAASGAPSNAPTLEQENRSLRQALHEMEKVVYELRRRQQLSVAQIRAHTELLGRIQDMVVVMDMEGVVGFVSPACYQFTGFSKKELLGQRLQDMLAPQSQEQFVLDMRHRVYLQSQRALTPAEQMSTYAFRTKDGGHVWGEVRGQAWQRTNENSVEIVIVVRALDQQGQRMASRPLQAAAARPEETVAVAPAPAPGLPSMDAWTYAAGGGTGSSTTAPTTTDGANTGRIG